METVVVSLKYQVVIPRSIRKSMKTKPGQKFQVIQYGSRIELMPVMPMKFYRGIAKGVDTTIEREPVLPA